MKYSDVRVGQKVLLSSYRRNSPKWSAAGCYLAEVLEVGVYTRYEVQVGWYEREYRDSEDGVLVRVQSNEADGEPWEKAYPAAFLTPAEGEPLALWEKARQDVLDRRRAREDRQQQDVILRERAAAALAILGIVTSEWESKDNLVTLTVEALEAAALSYATALDA